MLQNKGLSQKEVAAETGLPYDWLRKVSSKGLTRIEKRNEAQLKALCQFLGVDPIEKLWINDLVGATDEAALYAAKVTEIFAKLGSGDDSANESVADLIKMIDGMHNRTVQHKETPAKKTVSREEAIDYPAKLRVVSRSASKEYRALLDEMYPIIDTMFDREQSRQIRLAFREDHADEYEKWLDHFQSKEMFELAIGVALSTHPQAEVIDWLLEHDAPASTRQFHFSLVSLLKTELDASSSLKEIFRKGLRSTSKPTKPKPTHEEKDFDWSQCDHAYSDYDWSQVREKHDRRCDS
ncbi:helix-turn-helix transcriptional regulator [Stieleria sp. JC731]|uniref:helix-turn-helix domain-containing protein n=1 Tax=Stieleria sp. JC731 TaxID=2894195 RepID=UPI001E5819B9|nr:helix-turn-helix transcriptional regulator [Stieleria sp. JC731]MCC9602898.1 helix-turn-helix transcriptional regulator [Stieleria sp. JC731]